MQILLNSLTIIAFFVVGAYATTDIKRLAQGSTTSINDPSCYCDSCNAKLSLVDQIPLISYILFKGHCRHCNAKIPFSEFLFEFAIGITLSIIAFCFSFSMIGYFAVVLCYEGIKLFYLLINGIRKNGFSKEIKCSSANNIVIFLIIGFLFLLHNAVMGFK